MIIIIIMYDDDFDICTSISTQQPMGKEVHISVTWSATCPVNLRFFAAQPAPSMPRDTEKVEAAKVLPSRSYAGVPTVSQWVKNM